MNATTTKVLGDAGEHYALSMLSFAGKPSAKMPDNWKGYDLVSENSGKVERISVKTRSKTDGFNPNSWFKIEANNPCDWVVFVLVLSMTEIRSWIIPVDVAREFVGRTSEENSLIAWARLTEGPMAKFENNWELSREGVV